MLHRQLGRDTGLFHGGHVGFCRGVLLTLLNKRRNVFIGFRRPFRQRMLGRYGNISRAHQGIRPSGKYRQGLGGIVLGNEIDFSALATANPVALHVLNRFRPARHIIQFVQQLFRVVGNFKEPLSHFSPLHHRARAPTPAIYHLLVRQYGLVLWVPVHHGVFAIHHAFLVQAQKQPLLPLVVITVTGGEFPRPIHTEAQTLHLRTHVIDVVSRPLRWRDVVLYRRVFRRQTKGIPAHGVQYVVALQTTIACNHIAQGIAPHMAHMQPAAGIREHG